MRERIEVRIGRRPRETGFITLAHGGRLFRNLSPDELKEMLIEGPPVGTPNGRGALAGS